MFYKTRYFTADFETTVYDGQKDTEVWSAACVELNTEDVKIFGCIEDMFEFFKKQKSNLVVYFHNLKFDGSFWLPFLLFKLKYKQAYSVNYAGAEPIYTWHENKRMLNNTFKYSISERGVWYTITIKTGGHLIEIRDSLKLLPFSLARVGKAFKTPHQKLDMEYEGYRYPNCPISEKEREYIRNDVLVAKEALEIMFEQGHDKLTIGSCCLSEYKNICKHSSNSNLDFKEMFPDIAKQDSPIFDAMKNRLLTIDEYIRKSYGGGWTYLVKGKENKVKYNGLTADVNSLYPSMMSSESGNRYPIGIPNFWQGNYIPEEAYIHNHFYFVRIKTRFYIKEGMLPFIHIRNSYFYDSNENLESSDIWNEEEQRYFTHYIEPDGSVHDTRQELCLTMMDYELLKKHYNLVDFEILDGCWFFSEIGIFDEYIEKYKKQKLTSTGALRELAKLFLNNLYGKIASSTDSSFKIAYEKEDGVLGFRTQHEEDKIPGFIAVGSAITSYSRCFTITAAQKNYHGPDKAGFIYADTDSIHCDLDPDRLIDIPVDDVNFCRWKLEAYWDKAIFVRQKTYIEHVTHNDGKPVKPYYNIKCAGMPDTCKNLFRITLENKIPLNMKINDKGFDFILDNDGRIIHNTLKDFKVGLRIPCKLMPKRMRSGVLLTETDYCMH